MELIVKNLTKKFDNNIILDNINFKLTAGHIYGFVGRNGSGKSVLMSLIAQLDEPTCGQISVPKSGVGLVFQDADAQLFMTTVEEASNMDVIHALKGEYHAERSKSPPEPAA